MTPESIKQAREIIAAATKIPGWDGYAVTKDGQVVSLASDWRGYGARCLAQHLNSHGYPSVRFLQPDGTRRKIVVHQLVARTFLGRQPGVGCQVRHLNGKRTDNRLENLRWGTAKENADDREKHGNTARGYKNFMYKTHCLNGHDLKIHGAKKKGGGRNCRLCRRRRYEIEGK